MVTTPAKPEVAAPPGADPYEPPVTITLKLPADWDLTNEALIELAQINDCWRFELSAERELVIMSPEGRGSSRRGAEILTDISIWNRQSGNGTVLGAQGGIRLPDSSMRVPDVSWTSDQRWNSQDPEKEESLAQSCPELIVEIVSITDDSSEQREKMNIWIANGALLGWLIDPFEDVVLIYRPDAEPEQLERPDSLSGEDVCEGLKVSLERVWK